MRKRASSEFEKSNQKSKDKISEMRNLLEERQGKIKLNNKRKLIISLMCLIIVISILSFFLVQKNTVITSLTADQELLRAMEYGELTENDEKTESDYVRFSAFFLRDLDSDGYAEKVKGTCKKIGESDTLYMSLNVLTEGYFKDGKIEIQGNNIYFQTALVDDESINGNYISNNTTEINLKNINVGTQKLIFGEVRTGVYEEKHNKTIAIGNDTTKYSGINKVILTGIHVADDGTETEISKEIEFPVDWYNTPTAEIPYKYAGDKLNRYQSYNSSNIIDEENETLTMSFTIATQETKNLQILSKSYISGDIPQLNGYDPISVEISGKRVSYTYDEETRRFSAQREATLDLDGRVLSQAYSGTYDTMRYNEYKVKVVYPLDAYLTMGIDTINITVPIKAYYEGFNNPNEQFDNPVKSNIAEDIINIIYEFGGGDVIGFDVTVGEYIPSPYNAWVISKDVAERIYNNEESYAGEEEYDTYEVAWKVARGADGVISNIKLREQTDNYSDKFLTVDNQYVDMNDFIDNVGIYFDGADRMFGEDGYIDVFNDETNELIHRFTSDEWNNYTEYSPYVYEIPVKHIRIETSLANNLSSVYIYNVKRIYNDILTSKFTKEEFEKFRMICSYLNASIKYYETSEYKEVLNDIDRANYDSIKSIATISTVNPTVYSTQETKENVVVGINTKTMSYNTIGWKNGEFLLKFPKEILNMEIDNITISNNNVSIIGYSLEQKEDGFYLKILTENDYYETYSITVYCDITPDPRTLSATRNIELYAYNPECTSYLSESQDIYDVNLDGNTEEYVGKNTKSITLVGPTSIITMETASEYNEAHDELETSIAPQIAIIDKTQSEKTAKISASILNNYSGSVSEIKLVGKIPFEGNTFQLNDKELGSTYTAKMMGAIELPEAIRAYAKVYYSENEIVNNDIEDVSNNWILEDNITDFSNIKTYLIDLGDYVMQKGEEQICTYKVEIPNDVDYNEVAYSTHAVYFSLETSEGKLRDETETNKLGFMIARKYALEINKTKKNFDTKIQGASFSIEEVGTENKKILTTDSEGNIAISDLYVERDYIIKEIKAPYNYVRNDEEIKIRGTVVNGELVVERIVEEINELEDGTTETIVSTESLTVVDDTYGKTVILDVENEAKYTLRLTKYESGTENTIQGIQFSLFGKGMPSNGKYVTTNKDGQIVITGLYPGERYYLYEEYAEGYYYDSYSMYFTANWNNDVLEVNLERGNFRDEATVDYTPEHQPIVDLTLENTKLREYSLEITKFEKDTNTTLKDAELYINGLWLYEAISTDEDGKIYIPTLYEGINYYISEEVAPEGYTKSENIIRFIGNYTEEGELEITVYQGELAPNIDSFWEETGNVLNNSGKIITDKKVSLTQDESGAYTFKIGYENEPLFKLKKYDGSTYEPLEGAKFAIFLLDSKNELQVAKDLNGNIIGELKPEDIDIKFETIDNSEENQDTEEYYWTKNEEEVWYSGNYNVDSSKSTLTSKEFTLDENKLITFDWAASSESAYYDYLYYTVTNVETNETIGGTSNKIGGTSYGTTYGELRFENTGVYLEAGTYTISFTYVKDGSVTRGLDRGYVKNFSSGYYLVSTNELGQISLGLPEGTYKVVEIESPEGYVLPENEEDRTYYMSIGKPKPEEREVALDKHLTLETEGKLTFLQEIATSDGGTLVAGNITGTVVFEADKTVNGEEISVYGDDSVIIKYNNENKIEWAKKVYSSNLANPKKIIETEDGYVIAYEAYTINIPAEETVKGEQITLTTRNYDFMVIKYNLSGLVEWGVCSYGYTNDYIRDIDLTSDGGFIAVGHWNGTDINLLEDRTVSGEMISLVNKNGNGGNNAMMLKYNSNNLIEWAIAISGSAANYLTQVKEVTNADGEIEYICVAEINGATIDESDLAEGAEISYETGAYRGLIKFNSEGKIKEFYDSFGATPIAYTDEQGNTLLIQKNRVVEYNSLGEITKNVSMGTLPITFSGIEKCPDGSYIAVGTYGAIYSIAANLTSSGEAILMRNSGKTDFVIIKFTENFLIESARMFGSAGDDTNIKIVRLTNNQYSMIMNFDGTYLEGETEVSGATLYRLDDENTVVMIDNQIQEMSYFNDVMQTSDNGFLAVGYYGGYQNLNVSGEDITIFSKGGVDALLLKYDSSNGIEWYINFGGGVEDKFFGIDEVNGYYVAAVTYCGTVIIDGKFTESGEPITLTNIAASTYNGAILQINSDGKIVNYHIFNSTGNVKLEGLAACTETEYYVYGTINKSITFTAEDDTEVTITTSGNDDGMILKFNSDHKLIAYSLLGSGTNTNESFTDMTIMPDEGVTLVGIINANVTVTTKYGETITLTNSWQDLVVIRYDHELNIEWASHPGARIANVAKRRVTSTEDGGVIVTGGLYYGTIEFTADQTVSGEPISFGRAMDAWCGFVIKYNNEGLVEWAFRPQARGNMFWLNPIGYENGAILLMTGSSRNKN